MGILYLPFANQDAIDEPVMGLVSQQLLDYSIVTHLISALPRLPPDYVELPTGLLSRLILGDPQFATQFSEGGGLALACTQVLFSERNAIGVVVDALLMVSQLARASSENYERLHQADLYPAFHRLLQHSDSNVRAKMCNLLGNLCKHSPYFYSHLKKYVTVPLAVAVFVLTQSQERTNSIDDRPLQRHRPHDPKGTIITSQTYTRNI